MGSLDWSKACLYLMCDQMCRLAWMITTLSLVSERWFSVFDHCRFFLSNHALPIWMITHIVWVIIQTGLSCLSDCSKYQPASMAIWSVLILLPCQSDHCALRFVSVVMICCPVRVHFAVLSKKTCLILSEWSCSTYSEWWCLMLYKSDHWAFSLVIKMLGSSEWLLCEVCLKDIFRLSDPFSVLPLSTSLSWCLVLSEYWCTLSCWSFLLE